MNPTRLDFSVPLPSGYRANGILLHVTSLPSRFGIGDLGPMAFRWIDRLATARQSWWQVLPLGPTGFGHSPYQALSSFAANPLVISPEKLIEENLIDAQDCEVESCSSDFVDFESVIPFKEHVLTRAWENFRSGARTDLEGEFEGFCEEKAELQKDPALFMALRSKFGGTHFSKWPKELACREPSAIEKAKGELADAIDRFRFGQFLLLRQWRMLREYAHQRGIRLLGDLPIFVAPDSSDVWAEPELFLLDHDLNPTVVAGVPPDYFSCDGQLWGNPVYNWEVHSKTGYRWWIQRLKARLDHLDAIRIDHFRAFDAAWHVPVEAATAASGKWVSGPGADFFDNVRHDLGRLPLLAEDLGLITPAVTALRDHFGLPGMRVLQFAFNGDPNNPHLPHHCVHNGVVYTGTHDNDTTRGWYETAAEHERNVYWSYLQRAPGDAGEAVWEMIRLALSSNAALAVVPLQDVLGLGSTARMNIPGRGDGQWRWRTTEQSLDDPSWQRLAELTQVAGRTSERGDLSGTSASV